MNQKLLDYFQGDEFSASTWLKKYALEKEIDGELKVVETTPEDMHRRLAKEFYRIESKYPNSMSEEEIFNLFDRFKFIIPQGGSMSGIGNDDSIQSLSNCFVVGNPEGTDSYGGIFKIDEEIVQLEKRRGGVGTDLSDLRPEGTRVTNAAKSSSGLSSFMERFSNSTREVAQEGRRGALMLTCSIKHPDVEKFIDTKLDPTKVTGANVSVKITDEFVRCVIEDKPYFQVYPITTDLKLIEDDLMTFEYDTLNTVKIDGKPIYVRKISAKRLWNKLVKNSHKSAEPGILFWDRIIEESPADCYADLGFRTVSTNPCGELPLPPYDSCRLMVLNLYSYVVNPFTNDAYFDFELFSDHVQKAQRLMDDLIDLELEKIGAIIEKVKNDPEDEEIKSRELNLWLRIYDKTSKGRRTGLGITAEGDMLAALGLTYGSEESIELSGKVHYSLAQNSYISSIKMAEERGAFPIWDYDKEKDHVFINRILKDSPNGTKRDWKKFGRRNIANLTIAPAGTTSIMTQTTSGIEPAFLIKYKRRRKTDNKSLAVFTDPLGDMYEEYNVFHHGFLDWFIVNYKTEDGSKIDRKKGLEILSSYTEEALDELIASSPYHKATSKDVDWVSKVKLQGKVQQYVDHSISCTVNLPESVSEELVNQVFLAAWEAGTKGVTVYREGSRSGILIPDKDKPKKTRKRPESLDARVVRFKNDNSNWIAFIGLLDGKPYELFTGVISEDVRYLPKSITEGKIIRVDLGDGKRRYDFTYNAGYGYTNVLPNIGMAFNPEYFNYARLISALLREGVDLVTIINTVDHLQSGELINTWNRGVSRALRTFVTDGTKSGTACSKCGAELVYIGGCTQCTGCDFNKCD